MMNKTRTYRPTTHPAAPLARLLVLALTALLCLGAAMQARAQAPAGDPPSRVARLSDVSGQVWLYSPEGNEWVAVARNRPLTSGDRIATDNGARAEISLGTTTLRLDGATEFEIAQLDDSNYRVHLYNGSVAARLSSPASLAEFTLETDEGQFRVQAVGRYRFDRFEQASDLTVYSGQAVFEGRNSALPLTAGQHAQFWLDAAGAAQYNMVEPARDAFAAWNDERDRAAERPAAVRYVSPEMTGADDLDRYGGWEQTPDYGPIWTPRGVPADWAPYSAGRWAWVPPWGWTWVDDAPWGFAPFHYGRWVYHRNAWCWAPGTYVARPVYAPALVAWIGGPRVGVSISIGGGGPPVGWFPLAPHEVYVPSYRTSPRYVREVNITHVTDVTNITTIVNNVNGAADRRDFANRKFPNAVTVVPASVLTNRQPVAPVAAQLRGNAQVRALVADARPAPVLNQAPIAAPPAPARPVAGAAPVRPPFEARAPGLVTGRPGSADARRPEARPGDRPAPVPGAVGGAAPVAGAAPPARPPAAIAAKPPLTAPVAPAPQTPAAPPVGRNEAVRPVQGVPPNAAAIERPPPRGGVAREPGTEAPRAVVPPSPVQRPAPPVEAVRPAVVPRAEAPVVRGNEPRGEFQRPPPPRNSEAPRVPEAQRVVEPPRGAPPRPVEAPRVAPGPPVAAPPARPVEAPRPPEAAKVAPPEAHVGRPETPRREEKRDEKRDPNDKQQR
jgi:hypothetical protein